jgi:phage shock protein PspC (stress-responsive transcriptional regulator)
MDGIHATFRRHGLTRPVEGRVFGGVCAGLGRRLGLTPLNARVLFVVVLLLLPGSQLLVYPLLWLFMPSDPPSTASTRPY